MSDTRGISTGGTSGWRALAACGTDPDLMFPNPSDKAGTSAAKRVCASCPVRLVCLEHAMADEGGKNKDRRYGVLGGLSPSQRYHLHHRRRMQRKKQAAA